MNYRKESWVSFSLMALALSCASPQARPIHGIESGVSELKTFRVSPGGGVLAYEDSRAGDKVVVCVPGLGDTRGQFRLLAPLLVKAGYRVIVVDPRGQGDSDATFSEYGARQVGEDLVKLIDELKIDPYLIGNSSGAASAAWAAAERPGRIKGLVSLDGFLRDHPMGFMKSVGLRLALLEPWGTSSWISYYKSLFTSAAPGDQEAYTAALSRSLKQERHMRALRETIFSSKADIEARLPGLKLPVLALAGSKDPDFENPQAELDWIRSMVGGDQAMIANAGHYPHLEYPEQVFARVRAFLERPVRQFASFR